MKTSQSTFTAKITRAVKAEVARYGYDAKLIIRATGLSRNTVYSRLKEDSAFNTAELEAIVNAIGIDMETLIASASLEDLTPRGPSTNWLGPVPSTSSPDRIAA
ncbi:hypothetical protein MUN78_10045 [Leucobacter allii]|uniref:HTH cro/C1-type domain-containing protein n=1 Tax=Leucobacter allii TaxID=2932247 RepID=A0ABY4FHC7_9MICO|nr:hypothetical protein [Leucobacter allii]UOQ56044.1 hypothetical protein MUN78_10045 [Leucobacter allii]